MHCAMRVSEPWRWGTGPFGAPFWYPVQDQAMRVVGSERWLCKQKTRLPRETAAKSQFPVSGAFFDGP